MEQHASSATTQGPGLFSGLSSLARNAFGLMVSRVELVALELSEVRNHVLELLVIFALAIIAGWFALAYLTAMIVALSWEALGWKILLILFLVFAVAATLLALKAKAMLKEGKLGLPETMNELKADRDMLL